jgi:hypothetical protein
MKPVLHSSKNYTGTHTKKNYRPISLINIHAKIFNNEDNEIMAN